MRPASEIHSALEMANAELERQTDPAAANNIQIVRDVLAWVAGADVISLDGPTAWLAAFLLDDPPQIGPPPGSN